MNTITLQNIEHLHFILKDYTTKPRYKYRGQSNSEWKLIPKVGRHQFIGINDIDIFRHWKRRAFGILEKTFTKEIDYLAVAQHTGLPTRLLDWSHSPLIALFFCVVDNPNTDGAFYIYCTNPNELMTLTEMETFDPFQLNKSYYFHQPTSTINRLDNQFGHFTVHQNPFIPFEDICISNNLKKIIIPSNLKKEILLFLNHYGINYLTIYPDLEGLSKHLTWFYENYSIWKTPDYCD